MHRHHRPAMISVLHVDDDTGILDLTRLFLEKSENVSVECVESAHAALDKIGEQSYDVIISDYQMPGMDGIEFLKDLRTRGDHTPFIIFTGKGREDVVIDAFENGADYYIQKGGNPKAQYAELIQKIRKAVELRRAEEARQESEEQLLQIIGSLPDATFAIDTDGRVIAWNRAIEEMTGVSAEEMLGRGECEYAIPFYGERCPMLADMVLSPDLDAPERQGIFHRQGDHLYLQTKFARPRGQESILWAKASPLHDRAGRLKGAIESVRDITRWKKMEDSLRKSEEKYRQLVKNANEVIMVVQEGRIRFCNPRMAHLLGRPPIDLDGLAIVDFIHPDDRALVMDRQQRRAAGEDVPTNYQFRIVSSTGTVHWVLVNSARIVWKERPALLVLLSDISAQKEAEHDLRVANEDLAAANEELTSQIETIAQQNEDLHAAYEQLAATEEELRQNYEELEQSQALLRESEARYRLIVDAAQEGVWQMDGEMKTVFVNRAMAEMLGFTEAEMLGRDIRDFIPEDERAQQDPLIDLRREGKPSRYERTFVRKDGGTIVASVSATPVIDDRGRFRGSFAMLTNITRQKADAEALRMSEEWYRSLFDQSAEGIFLHDLEGNILDVNHAAVTQSGYSRDELLQMTVFDLHPENADDRDDILRQWHDWEPEQPVTIETSHRRKDGSLFPAEVRTGVVRIGDGTYMFALVQDITERKRAENVVKESEERYRVLVNSLNEGIWHIDRDGYTTFVNPRMAEMLGYSGEEMVGKNLFEFIDPTAIEHARENLQGTWQGMRKQHEFIFTRRDGTPLHTIIETSPITSEDGEISGAVAGVLDITERKAAEEALHRAHRQIRILTGITRHDILNSIMIAEGYLDLLPDAGPAEQKEYLENTQRIIEKIQRQIEFTRQYENLGSQEPQWVDLNAIIGDLEVPDSIHLDTVGIEWRIFSDPMLRKVFANLLDNTIRHGGAVTRIRVTATETDDGLQITWEDDGKGIPANEKEKIFERGYGKNTGLGLFFAREILALTGISITETGAEGQGARFELRVHSEGYAGPARSSGGSADGE
ncbi:MAG: PAS domain S-box protein [Methanomicrobiales archaeon]